MPLQLIADDLTGALDSAAGFGSPSRPVTVTWSRLPDTVDASFAVSTETRDVSAETARALLTDVAEALSARQNDGILFKKLDSLLRGHPALELAMIARRVAPDRIVIAPAHPALGRITRSGWQHVRTPAGDYERIPVDLAGELQAMTSTRAATRCPEIIFANAETEADLQAVVARERGRGGRILWCGSGGLAQALAGERSDLLPVPTGRTVAVIGTDHPVAAGQIAALRDRSPDAVLAWRPDDTAAEIADRIERRLDAAMLCVVWPEIAGRSRLEAAATIATKLAAVLPRLSKPDNLFCSGGETLRAVCDVLGADALLCEGFVADGIPVSWLRGGRWSSVPIMSKSGAFGPPQALADLFLRSYPSDAHRPALT